ncbi:alpha/beta hydrolase family protein [Pyxidicoccus xibeiensis]|uniref:alpha/beta hydrolase family protein n=1 Tax=Pyxidicoccus xibeiensis TaxID=2906759 RepID=UPI0020A81421|nr:alpha/beta fold hydrolase [Pyxidicoccus xibeiensis]MCP3140179.1 alpha/beta fold hydrolase [Pyxidicoccus xibeiensis]
MMLETPLDAGAVRAEDVLIPARDGVKLAATLYEGPRSNGVAVPLNPATAVPRRYYDAFARFLAGRGFTVVTYDYRGMGESKLEPSALRRARFQDWGELDAPGVQDWLVAHRPAHRLALVGHSAGGQMLGLAESVSRLRAVLLIAPPHGWWRNWRGADAAKLALLWYGLMPVTTRVLGYFPCRLAGMGNLNLPGGIARQWARWARSRHYVSDEHGAPLRPYNDRLRAPLRVYSFSDDFIAPEPSVRALLDYYPRAKREYLYRTPAQLGVERVGHFGWFRPTLPQALWAAEADWLEQNALADDGAE